MAIIVTGAAGDLGGMVARELLAAAPAEEIVLVSRRPDALESLVRPGVQVRGGDFDDPSSLASAFAGGERLLLISTTKVGPVRRRQHEAAVEAARKAGVRHLVYTSSVGIHPRNPCFVIPDHIHTEALIAASGLQSTILRMGCYADIQAKFIAPQAVATGQWISPAGEGLVAFVDKGDCARAAVGVLTEPGHEGAVYEITGPELLSHRDAAALASQLSGRPIEYVIPGEADGGSADASEAQAETWIGEYTLEQLMSFEVAVRQGYYAICTRAVEMITHRSARTLLEVYRDNLGLLTGPAT